LTRATSFGGKPARATRPRSILKTRDAVAREPSPAGYAIGGHIEARGDLAVGVPVGGQQHRLRADDDAVGEREAGRPALELATHVGVELDRCRHSPHAITSVNPRALFNTTELAAGSTN
jgi:hypothetical protein